MRVEALLLTGRNPSHQNQRMSKVLDFFGVPSRTLMVKEFLNLLAAEPAPAGKLSVLCPAEAFVQLIDELDRNSEKAHFWKERVHSAFVYAGENSETLRKLACILAQDDAVTLREGSAQKEFVVSEGHEDFTGVMTGVRAVASGQDVHGPVVLHISRWTTTSIITLGNGAVFSRLVYKKVPVFLLTSRSIIDLNAEVGSRNFDICDHFLAAVPIVLYAKWAFAATCWSGSEANACLVIDDPLLKSRYGFVNFQELLALMEQHRFSTNIAFIPWNWRRSHPSVVKLFKENPEKYSLSIHGCDHTHAEFGSRDRDYLCRQARQAIDRMVRHEQTTGVRHDRIMVFPQGVFSEVAMGVLKEMNFTAAVNTEALSVDPEREAIRISDVWDVAVMDYRCFPMFTRRYPAQGIENFAFDILLGKPCIVVIHHDFCRGRYTDLVEFIQRLNALNCSLSWRSLGEVVRRSWRQRQMSSGSLELEMYGSELRLHNRSGQRQRFLVRRRESAPATVKEIRVGSQQVVWNSFEGCLHFEVELDASETVAVAMEFQEFNGNGRSAENVSYRIKTRVRRYLSEVRDNYIVTSKDRFSRIFK